jgi:hypothetical protein
LVRSERNGGRVRQVTLLNLGSEFGLPPGDWPGLCTRIDEILHGQTAPALLEGEPPIEHEAQRLAALLLARSSDARLSQGGGEETVVEMQSLELVRVRTVGVEQVALWAMTELQLAETLQSLGMPQRQVHVALGMIAAQMAVPGAEGATRLWWEQRSAIGELLGVDFATVSPLALYRTGDNLLKYRKKIERQVFARLCDRLGLAVTQPLFDLSNTCFDGDTGAQLGRGPGLVKGSPGTWPPVTLGLAVDGSGFVQHSASFVAKTPGVRPFRRCSTNSVLRPAPW